MFNIRLPEGDYDIIHISDMHLIDENFRGTDVYVEEQEKALIRLIEAAENKVFNTAIFLGDLFDRTYQNVDKTLYHVSLLSRLNKALDNRVFKVMGNHTLNKGKQRSLTMFLSGEIKSQRIDDFNKILHISGDKFLHNYGIDFPILNVTDRLLIGDIVFNLFHYSRESKNYIDPLTDLGFKPRKHVGVYHDSIVSSSVRSHISMLLNDGAFDIPFAVTTTGSDIFSNVDYAVIGDIHTRVGEFIHVNPSNGKETNVDIPGSIGRTQNSAAQHHNFVNLPVFHLRKNGDFWKSHIHFDLLDHKKLFKSWMKEERKGRQQRLDEFNHSINLLQSYTTIEQLIEMADISETIKEILFKAVEGEIPPIKYRDSELYKNLI